MTCSCSVDHLVYPAPPACEEDFVPRGWIDLLPRGLPGLPAYPYSLEALLTCDKCWAVFPPIYAHPSLDGWRLDTIVEHHAAHRRGRCCPDPEEKAA